MAITLGGEGHDVVQNPIAQAVQQPPKLAAEVAALLVKVRAARDAASESTSAPSWRYAHDHLVEAERWVTAAEGRG